MDVTAVAQVADVLLPQGDFSSQPAEQFFPVLLGKLAARNEQSPNRGEEAEAAGWPLVPIIVDSRKWTASSFGTPRAIQEGLLGGELESAEGVTDSTGGLLQEEAEAGSTVSLLGHETGEDPSPTYAAASWAATAIPMALKTPAQAGVLSKESYPPGHTRSALGEVLSKPPWNDVAPLRWGAHGAASPEMRQEGLLRAELNEVPNAVLHEPEGTAKPFGFPAGEDGRSNEAVRFERGSSRDLGIPPDLKPLDFQRGSEGQEVLRPGWALGSDGSSGVMDQGGAPELNVQLPRAAELRADPNTSVSTATSSTAGQERVWRGAQSAGSFQWGGAQVAYISLDPPGVGPVRLKVRVTKEVVDAVFTVQSPQQKVFLEDGLWQLRHGLWERGLSPQQLWVEVGSNGEGRDAQKNAPGVPLHAMVHPHSVLEEEVIEFPTYSHTSGSILHVRV
ncbi:MAG: flagellar hook-length control protein FliK [Thermodesulfobacteriota bacterium]